MKKLTTLILLLLCAVTLFAQAPDKFTYQAVVRNANNTLVANAQVGVRVNILQGTATGSAVYSETHMVSSNANGLVTLNIGAGSVLHGSFANIDWADGPYFLKTDIDPNGGNDYSITSTQQLLSVPYALYAKEAANSFSGDYNDLTNTPQIPTVPANVSLFNNDAHYITEAQLNALLASMNSTIDSLRDRVEELEMHAMQPHADTTVMAQACLGLATVTDYDQNVYNTVQIGNQCWMRENLRSTHYADGTAIAAGTTSSTSTAYYYPLQGDFTYGYLYNWKAVMRNSSNSQSNPSGVQGICPNGWHVPSDAEWDELLNYVSSQNHYLCNSDNNNMAKALASTTGWSSSTYTCAVGNTPASNNATGFSAVPAGYHYGSSFGNSGNFAHFWSSTEYNSSYAYGRYLGYGSANVYSNYYNKSNGYSVRCIRD